MSNFIKKTFWGPLFFLAYFWPILLFGIIWIVFFGDKDGAISSTCMIAGYVSCLFWGGFLYKTNFNNKFDKISKIDWQEETPDIIKIIGALLAIVLIAVYHYLYGQYE